MRRKVNTRRDPNNVDASLLNYITEVQCADVPQTFWVKFKFPVVIVDDVAPLNFLYNGAESAAVPTYTPEGWLALYLGSLVQQGDNFTLASYDNLKSVNNPFLQIDTLISITDAP